MEFRFVAYDPKTDQRLYQLPRTNSVQIGDTFGTRGTLELKYSAKAIDARDLPTFLKVQAEVTFDNGHTWAEVGPSLLRLSGEHEDTDQAGMRTLRFVGREWILDKARVGTGELELIDGKRPFYQSSPGRIIRTLILEAQDRGAAQGIKLGNFTTDRDAAGNLWPKVATIYYSPGLPIASVLENLVEQGMCDYRMDGDTLNLYAPETAMGRDLTDRANPVRVHSAVTEAPVKYSLEDLASSALLIGDEGFELEVDNPSAPDDYGRLEVTIEQGGVSDPGTARIMVDEALQRGSREIKEITRSQSASGASFLPYRDYRVGDYVQVLEDGQWQKYRVRELQLTRDGQDWTIHAVINDRLQELLLKLAKRTNGIVNGTKGSGGDGTRPTPPENPGIEPAAPEGLIIDQMVYLDRQGIARGQITAGWGAVTESTKGQAVEIGGYELWTRHNETRASWVRVASTDGYLTATHSPVVLSDADGNALEYQWRVRAIAQASNRPGPWSNTVTLTMTQDTTPPPPPSLPTVETDLRIITVDWDGLDEDGEQMPVDFNHVRVYFAGAEDMTGAERVGSLSQRGMWNSGSMEPDEPVWVAASAVDNVGNESVMTPAQSVTPRKLVDDDSIRDAVDGIDDKINDAVDDLNRAIDDIVIDVEGTKNFYTSEMPMEGMDEGDLWYDPSDKNKPYIYQDGEWITVRDQFLKPPTTRNVTDWGLLKPNLSAIQGQWSATDYRIETEASELLGEQSLAVVNIPTEDLGNGYITMPFQGVLDGSAVPDYSDDLFVNEGRPISIDLQLLYSGPFEPVAAQRTLTAHYFAAGVLVDSIPINYASLTREVFPAEMDFDNIVAYYAYALGYQYGMRITGTVMPTTVAGVDEIALTVAIPLPAGKDAEKKLAIWSIDTRVQVPTTGLADGAITETKVSDDAISTPKLRANAITAGKIAANAIETDHLKSKVITGDKLAVGAITADSGIIGSINAGTILFGEMDGARLKAQSIYSDKLLIGGDRNMVPNGDLSRGSADGWPGSPTYRTSNGPPSNTAGVANVYYRAGQGTTSWTDWGRFPVQNGETLVFECWVKCDKSGSVLFIEVRDQDGSHLSTASNAKWESLQGGAGATSYPVSNWTVPTRWTKVVSTLKVGGAGTREAVFGSAYFNHSNGSRRDATPYLAGIKLYRQNGATLIEDGAITTDKILANAITAGKIAAGAIEAGHISANAVAADKIRAGAIDGKLITGARIRTAASGRRTELDVEGLRSYDSSGSVVLTTQTSDGSIDMRGRLRQTIGGTTIQVGYDYNGGPGIGWSDSNNWSYSPGVRYGDNQAISGKKDTLLQGPGASNGNTYLSLYERGDGFDLLSWKGSGSSYRSWQVRASDSDDFMSVGNRGSAGPYLSFKRGTGDTGQAWFGYQHPSNGGYATLALRDRYIWLGAYDSAGNVVSRLWGDAESTELTAGTRNLYLRGKGIYMPSLPNDSDAVGIGRISGQLHSIYSSRRYKILEEPIEATVESFEDKLLSVGAKTWIDKTRAERVADYENAIANGEEPDDNLEGCGPLERIPGVVAEDLNDAGLEIFVRYDEDGLPQSVRYDRIGPALIPIIRRLRDRVDALEQQLGATA